MSSNRYLFYSDDKFIHNKSIMIQKVIDSIILFLFFVVNIIQLWTLKNLDEITYIVDGVNCSSPIFLCSPPCFPTGLKILPSFVSPAGSSYILFFLCFIIQEYLFSIEVGVDIFVYKTYLRTITLNILLFELWTKAKKLALL